MIGNNAIYIEFIFLAFQIQIQKQMKIDIKIQIYIQTHYFRWKIIEIIQKMRFFLPIIFGFAAAANGLKCQSGSVPDLKNICIRPKYIEGCFTYSTQQTCSACNYNYKLDQATGLCTFDASSTEPCCLEPGAGKTCRTCNRGMSLIDGQCQQTQSLGCLQKAVNGDCTNCASDFVLQGTKCRKGVRYCEIYSKSNQNDCQKCLPTYSLVSNVCLKNKILGCKTEQNGSCTSCFQPFKPKDGHCDIKYCKEYNDFGCQSCQCGFYITKRMTCEKVQQGCVRYQKGTCTDCFPPFTLQGTACVVDGCKSLEGPKCTKCSQEYKLQNGVCILPNCLKGKNGRCQICKQGFNYNNGECLSSVLKKTFSSN